jgi:exodeoxyribonuclease VII small subunit
MGDETKPAGEPSFEDELQNVERTVNLLERGELDLEESIRQYESGFQSLKRCYQILERAQKRIEVLVGGEPSAAREGEEDSSSAGAAGSRAAGPIAGPLARWRPWNPPSAGGTDRASGGREEGAKSDESAPGQG